MKKVLLLCTLMVLFLISCEKEVEMDYQAYGTSYYEIMTPLEEHLDQNYYKEVSNMITLATDLTFYSHEDFKNYFALITDEIAEQKFLLAELGPSISDETLQMYQGDLELKLSDYETILLKHAEGKNIGGLVPSRFPLKADLYDCMEELNDIQEDILKLTYDIETYLTEKGVLADEAYMNLKLKNMLRFDYVYAMLGSHTSTHQDATGLWVQPARTDMILDNDHYRRVLEIDPITMNQVCDYINEQLIFYRNYDLSKVDQEGIIESLSQLVEAYGQYETVRSTFSNDFFFSGEYKNYQSLKKRIFDDQFFDYAMVFRPEITNIFYDFDESYYDEYPFESLYEHFWQVQHALFSKEHCRRMGYENLYDTIEFPIWEGSL